MSRKDRLRANNGLLFRDGKLRTKEEAGSMKPKLTAKSKVSVAEAMTLAFGGRVGRPQLH